MINLAKSEGSQHIYRFHKPAIETEFGTRAMSEIGNIKGLEKDDTANYILIPGRVKDASGKEYTASWEIYRIKPDSDIFDSIDIENFEKVE